MPSQKTSHAAAIGQVAAAKRFRNAGNPLTFVAETIKDVEKAYGGLKDQEAREAFWNEFTAALDRNSPQGWAAIYHGLAMLRKSDWYWKAKGYASFNEFLRKETSFTFGQLERLEKRYHFAATACPQLFNMTEADADAYLEQHGIAADLPAANVNGTNQHRRGLKQKKSVSTLFSPASEVDVESQPEEFQRGFKARGGGTYYCRFRRLKRDAPKVAQMILDGEFTRTRGNGSLFIDMVAAESLAAKEYGAKPPKLRPSQKKSPVEKAKAALEKLSQDEWNAVVAWMNKQS